MLISVLLLVTWGYEIFFTNLASFVQMRVSKLNSILGMKEEPSEQNLPLIARERSLVETYKHLSLIVSSRMDRFKSLVAEHQRLCNSLGEPPKNYTFEYVPSLQLLGTIERDINELLIKLVIWSIFPGSYINYFC